MTSEISSDPNAGPQLVIWGTDVVVEKCKEKFKRFVETFIDPDAEDDEKVEGMRLDEPLYLQRLEEVKLNKIHVFSKTGPPRTVLRHK